MQFQVGDPIQTIPQMMYCGGWLGVIQAIDSSNPSQKSYVVQCERSFQGNHQLLLYDFEMILDRERIRAQKIDRLFDLPLST